MTDIEALRLRLEDIVLQLQQFETKELRLDPKLVNELNFLVTYLHEQGFTADVVREGSVLRVRLQKHRL